MSEDTRFHDDPYDNVSGPGGVTPPPSGSHRWVIVVLAVVLIGAVVLYLAR